MADIYKGINVLAGAGIKTQEDMKVMKKMGGVGVILASGVIKAEDPEKVLMELAG